MCVFCLRATFTPSFWCTFQDLINSEELKQAIEKERKTKKEVVGSSDSRSFCPYQLTPTYDLWLMCNTPVNTDVRLQEIAILYFWEEDISNTKSDVWAALLLANMSTQNNKCKQKSITLTVSATRALQDNDIKYSEWKKDAMIKVSLEWKRQESCYLSCKVRILDTPWRRPWKRSRCPLVLACPGLWRSTHSAGHRPANTQTDA